MMQSVSELFEPKKIKVWLETLDDTKFRYPKELETTFKWGVEPVAQSLKTEAFDKRFVAEYRVTMENLVAADLLVSDEEKEEIVTHMKREMRARLVHYLYGEIQKDLRELTYEVMRLESYTNMADPYNGPSARLESILQKISL